MEQADFVKTLNNVSSYAVIFLKRVQNDRLIKFTLIN